MCVCACVCVCTCVCVQGRNVLFHCIDNDTDQSVIDYILHKGSAYLVTQRVEVGVCWMFWIQQIWSNKFLSLCLNCDCGHTESNSKSCGIEHNYKEWEMSLASWHLTLWSKPDFCSEHFSLNNLCFRTMCMLQNNFCVAKCGVFQNTRCTFKQLSFQSLSVSESNSCISWNLSVSEQF